MGITKSSPKDRWKKSQLCFPKNILYLHFKRPQGLGQITLPLWPQFPHLYNVTHKLHLKYHKVQWVKFKKLLVYFCEEGEHGLGENGPLVVPDRESAWSNEQGLAQSDWPVASSVDNLQQGPGSAATGKGRASFSGHSPHVWEPRQTVPERSRCSATGLCFWGMSSSLCCCGGCILYYVKGFGWFFCPLLSQNEEDKASLSVQPSRPERL